MTVAITTQFPQTKRINNETLISFSFNLKRVFPFNNVFDITYIAVTTQFPQTKRINNETKGMM